MENDQLDIFDYLAELNKPIPSNEQLDNEAINSVRFIVRNPMAKSSDVINAAKLILQVTGKLIDKKQFDVNQNKSITELTDDELVKIASGS